jgi:hypothetical protein
MRTTASITDMSIPTQRRIKHVFAAANKHTIIEEVLEEVTPDKSVYEQKLVQIQQQKRGR